MQTLRHFLQIEIPELGSALDITKQIITQLERWHQQGMVYGGLFPERIAIEPETQQIQLLSESQGSHDPVVPHPNVVGKEAYELAYMAPEQTGRMNRTVDWRADFYALGILLYEMLVGYPPFQAKDAMEWVHCHLAKPPVPPHKRNSQIPETVSEIVLKLLAKAAEDRYQSTEGVKADLEKCSFQWEKFGTISPFVLGKQDVSDTFHIATKLYGRDEEVNQLLDEFHAVLEGGKSLLWVAGYSGVGKSTLIHQLHEPVVRHRGYFICGKFDQVQRNVPYRPLSQAFDELVRQLLSETNDQLARWKRQWNRVLGINGQVILEIIPSMEHILGPQPEIPTLPPQEAQNRFNLVFYKFMQVVAQPDHPLVLFVDDMQWADEASLRLIEFLLMQPLEHVLLVGAYRGNEVTEQHPLHQTRIRLEKAKVPTRFLSIGPLDHEALQQLLSDTFRCPPESTLALAELVLEKTSGNPFFVKQCLQAMHARRLVVWDATQRRWEWDLNAMRKMPIADNVAELMLDKILTFPSRTQRQLQLAACLGNRFSAKQLAHVCGCSEAEIVTDLLPASEAGLIQPDGTDYTFLHDRVQQTFYDLIPPSNKPNLHRKIAHSLWDEASSPKGQDNLFDLVNHWNLGKDLIHEEWEQLRWVELNLQAGKLAKTSAAYGQAHAYLQTAIDHLPPDSWLRHTDITWSLYLECAECDSLTGDHDAAETKFNQLLQNSDTVLRTTQVHISKIKLYVSQGLHRKAMETGLKGLQQLGFADLERPEDDWETSIIQLQQELETHPEPLLERPEMTGAENLAAIEIMVRLFPSAYALNWNFSGLLVKSVGLSIRHGNSPWSAVAYGGLGALLGVMREDYAAAYRFGKLGVDLSDKWGYSHLQTPSYHNFSMLLLWSQHAKHSLYYSRKAYQYGLDSGDWIYAGFAISTAVGHRLFLEHPLAEVAEECETALDFVERVHDRDNIDFLMCLQAFVRHAQQGATPETEESQNIILQRVRERKNYSNLSWCIGYKLQSLFMYERYSEAEELVWDIQQWIPTYLIGLNIPEYAFFAYLVFSRLYPEASPDQQARYQQWMETQTKRMEQWAEGCPENFRHKYLLMSAERMRLEGQRWSTIENYAKAIQVAQEQGFTRHVALGHELAAKFYREQGLETYAAAHFQEACRVYQQWGAHAKADHLQSYLLPSKRGFSAGMLSYASKDNLAASALDLSSVTKALQAISEEIVLRRLLENLITILMENAGAQRGFLILSKEGRLRVEAEGSVEPKVVHVLQAVPLDQCEALSRQMVRYVARTQESVILHHTVALGRFAYDPYLLSHQPKSVLCSPILHQGKLTGILYLENNATPDAFNSERLKLLQLLSSQAAISLENARLYANAEELVASRTQALEREVTEKEQAYNLLKSIFDGMAEGVVTLDQHFCVQLLSARACHILGVSEDSALNKPAAALMGSAVAGPSGVLVKAVGRFSQDKENISNRMEVQTELLCPSGAVIPVYLSIIPLEPALPKAHWLLIFRDRREEERWLIETAQGTNFGKMISSDPQMRSIFQFIENIAKSNSTVLIQGESGTGKELVASEIHTRSRRAQKSFHAINCAAIPANLLESEFFGHERGAFTGAQQTKLGHFELANGGTLFLDEVGEIPLELQGKLLRALQELAFRRVGGTKSIAVDVRIIAATNRDLLQMVEEKSFREDLYYRLDVLSIQLPPLRERVQDIPFLVNAFIRELNVRDQRSVSQAHPEAIQVLLQYNWPGNIRELYNVIEYAFAVSQGQILRLEHLPEKLKHLIITKNTPPPQNEKEAILRALEQANYRKNKAAALLGMSYVTLYRKLKKYDIS